MSIEKKTTWVFNASTGITRQYKSIGALKDPSNFLNGHALIGALYRGKPTKEGMVVSSEKISREVKLKEYNKIWADKAKGEVWKESRTAQGVEVSNRGRARNEEGFIFPLYAQGTIKIRHNKKLYNLAILIAEEFILNRKATSKEQVFRKAGYENLQVEFLYVLDRDEAIKRTTIRNHNTEIEMIDEEGNVLETFSSYTEAGEKLFMHKTTIAKAIKNNRKCGGLMFRLANQ